MAFSRKYETVWYHPTSSKLWHLTTLLFVNFRKIDWHALESARVLSQLVRLAVCLARGADFASTVPITFSRADQWTSFSEPGRFPLVLKPVVAGSRLNKVLIDGGSGLNVLSTKTLKKMKLDITHMLTKSTSPFCGIIPGNAAIPLGSVVLPVTFGETKENYCTEYIKFEVADFETSYHAILGRPVIAKFMAVPHYTYLVL
jgi:hypothetical protein